MCIGRGGKSGAGAGIFFSYFNIFFVLNYIIYFWFSLFVVFYQLNIT